ncbi:MAG: DUF2971 domain-containing protein [Syntrophales bacterium]
MDDITESQRHSGVRFGSYFFVSCWTYDSEESIPQWHMYTDRMRGVRISLPVAPFQQKQLVPPAGWKVESEGVLYAPLSLEEQFGPNYFVVPMFMEPKHFGGPVEYCDDVEERYDRAISLKIENGHASVKIGAPFDLVRLKTSEWSFQKEYRFALFALPSLPVPADGPGSPEFYERFPSHVANAIVNGIAPGIEYLDVDLAAQALREMEVTLGPLCSEGSKVVVRSLVNAYAPEATVRESRFTGNIRAR